MKIPKIYGFNKSSEAGLDIFVPSIFLAGCNLRCPYCMNSRLVEGQVELPEIDINDVKKYVIEDKSKMLMISGGEPLLAPDDMLINLFKEIKSWGCKIGISTNGVRTKKLKSLMPYFNYVALDVKSGSDRDYARIGREDINEHYLLNVLSSKSFLKEVSLKRDDFTYEIRTTLYPPFINENSIKRIGIIICPNETWILQQFRHANNMLDSNCNEINPYDENEVKKLLKIAQKYTKNVYLRYV